MGSILHVFNLITDRRLRLLDLLGCRALFPSARTGILEPPFTLCLVTAPIPDRLWQICDRKFMVGEVLLKLVDLWVEYYDIDFKTALDADLDTIFDQGPQPLELRVGFERPRRYLLYVRFELIFHQDKNRLRSINEKY